jgi:hypothetical protein
VFISLQKTRLLDPTLNFLGTNDHPGDYRSSGCSACHVAYANDRSPTYPASTPSTATSAWPRAARRRPRGSRFVKTVDPAIPKDERATPITHRFTLQIPTSQCIVCHIHPGTNVLRLSRLHVGTTRLMGADVSRPAEKSDRRRVHHAQMNNPDETAARGCGPTRISWSVPELNSAARHTQFADFHGHGWVYRAVFKRTGGNLLDHRGGQSRTSPPEADGRSRPAG